MQMSCCKNTIRLTFLCVQICVLKLSGAENPHPKKKRSPIKNWNAKFVALTKNVPKLENFSQKVNGGKYSVGTAPIISYHFGAENHSELKGLRKKSLRIIGIFAVIMLACSYILAKPLSIVFVGYDQELLDLTSHAFSIFAFSFLFSGYAIFGSSFFTALNNGLISATISFVRTMLFQVVAVLIFPLFLGIDGIWLSIVVAELLAVAVTILFLKGNQKKYHY